MFFSTGKGVFAGRDFGKGEFLLEYDGERISFKEGKNRLENYPDGIGSFLYLSTSNKRRVGMFHFMQEVTIITFYLCFDYMIVYSVMCIACRLRGVTIQLKHIMIYRDSLGLYWVFLLFKVFFFYI